MNQTDALRKTMQNKTGEVKPTGFLVEFKDWLKRENGGNYKQLVSLWGTPEEARRFIVFALECVQVNPDIMKCSLESFYIALMKCAQCRLYPGPGLNEAALVPYKNKVTFIPQYQGLVKLAINSGWIVDVWAYVVRQKDKMQIHRGLERSILFEPLNASRKDRGERVGVYACFKTVKGNVSFEYMNAYEVDEIRDRSPGAGSSFSPWNGDAKGFYGDTDWMWKKTVLKQLLKFAPKSVDLQYALMYDNESEGAEEIKAKVTFDIDAVFTEIDAAVDPESPPEPQKQPEPQSAALPEPVQGIKIEIPQTPDREEVPVKKPLTPLELAKQRVENGNVKPTAK